MIRMEVLEKNVTYAYRGGGRCYKVEGHNVSGAQKNGLRLGCLLKMGGAHPSGCPPTHLVPPPHLSGKCFAIINSSTKTKIQ